MTNSSDALLALLNGAKNANVRLMHHVLDALPQDHVRYVAALQAKGYRVCLEMATTSEGEWTIAMTAVGSLGERLQLVTIGQGGEVLATTH